ncbi:hypothetical protein C2G38_2032015 [Gigaspora rosea]|uniref:Uncharacterized protein n=1 Tax=Gigaspora rosea TaxID=44941 RepID=A0A397VP27_9GLOM|nr:hypothetical protein C2G38_2032015 [Gigaspora rosea]
MKHVENDDVAELIVRMVEAREEDDGIKLAYDRRKLDQAEEKRVEYIPVVFDNRSETTGDGNGDSNEPNNRKSGRGKRACVETLTEKKCIRSWQGGVDVPM